MKKILKGLAFAFAGVLSVAALASCDGEHQHSYSWVKDATKHKQVCEECKEETPYEAHTWGDWTVTTTATEDKKGEKEHTCSDCGYVGKEAIPELPPACGVATAETAVYAQVPAEWDTVYCYYWNGLEGEANTLDPELVVAWPGYEMTEVNADSHLWGFKVPAGVDHVIFNNGEGVQTVDIEFALAKNLYVLDAEANAAGKFDFVYRSYTPTANDPELAGAIVTKIVKITLYAQLPEGWEAQKIHYWGVESTDWPGTDMEVVDADKHIYKVDNFITSSGFLFHNGSGTQTGNLALFEDKDINIIIVADDTSVSYGKYENGTITPVEVEIDKTITELYIVGTINGWSKNNDYKMTIADNTATIELTLAEGAEFKVFDGDWNHDWATFGYVDSLDAECFGEAGGNIKVLKANTYTITVSNLDTTPVLSIVVKP